MNRRLPLLTPSQIEKANIISECYSLEEGIRNALQYSSKHREIQTISKLTNISPSTLYAFKDGRVMNLTLKNAEDILDAMGLEIIVRPMVK